MILDTLVNANRYASLHPLFSVAFDYLRQLNPASVEPGTVPIQGDDLFAIVSREDPDPAVSPSLRLEAHRRYIDIQVALEGKFPIGWRALRDCKKMDVPYSEEKDVVFFSDPVECVLTVGEGEFAILYPEDGHVPGPAMLPLLKVVLKVAVTAGQRQRHGV